VSHTSPDALLALARGFQESRVLLTGAELDLFTVLSKEALTAEAIAARLGADLRALKIELDALAAMGLLVKADDTYRTSPDASCLSADAPDSIHPMLLHAATLWHRWSNLPPVVEIARERLSAAGLLERVTLVAGDFEKDPLPPGHDLAWLSAIIHQNGPAQNDALYACILHALVPGGRLVIRDHVMEPGRTRPLAGALFAVNMLVGTKQGGTYTFDEIKAGLERAGFTRVRLLRSGDRMDSLVEAFKF